jgi:hypothetical protein
MVHGLGREVVKGKAAGCAGAESLGGEILSGIEEGEDGKDGKLRAKLLDGVQRLKIGGVKIEG